MATLIRSALLAEGTRKVAVRERVAVLPSRSPDKPPERTQDPVAREPTPTAPAGPSPMDVVQREQQAWMAQAKAELAAARDREEQAARAAGFAKGQAEAQAAYRDRLQDLERLLAALGQAVERQVGGLEDLAVGVGFEVACKVLGERLVTREGVRALAEQVLVRVRTEEPVVLRLSPRDFSLLLQQPGEAPVTAPHRLELVPDERIELGGCMVETASGSLDARLETQIDALRHVLLDVQQRRR